MTTNHFLTRNPNNEPTCSCGYRPAILDEPAPVGKQWKARTAVFEHADALNEAEHLLNLKTTYAPARRSPLDPFHARTEPKYPRAGVRKTEDGRWLLSCWDGDRIVHVIDEPVFDDRVTAFDYAWLTIGACRQAGTNLNGWAA